MTVNFFHLPGLASNLQAYYDTTYEVMTFYITDEHLDNQRFPQPTAVHYAMIVACAHKVSNAYPLLPRFWRIHISLAYFGYSEGLFLRYYGVAVLRNFTQFSGMLHPSLNFCGLNSIPCACTPSALVVSLLPNLLHSSDAARP